MRTKEQIVPDLIMGLSAATSDEVAILLSDLRIAVGQADLPKYLAADYETKYLEDMQPSTFKLMPPHGMKHWKHKLVHVQRAMLLERLVSDSTASKAPKAA